jgi:hypothetical protein
MIADIAFMTSSNHHLIGSCFFLKTFFPALSSHSSAAQVHHLRWQSSQQNRVYLLVSGFRQSQEQDGEDSVAFSALSPQMFDNLHGGWFLIIWFQSQVYAASKDELKKKLVGVATEVPFSLMLLKSFSLSFSLSLCILFRAG